MNKEVKAEREAVQKHIREKINEIDAVGSGTDEAKAARLNILTELESDIAHGKHRKE